jgi:hypothetical protein
MQQQLQLLAAELQQHIGVSEIMSSNGVNTQIDASSGQSQTPCSDIDVAKSDNNSVQTLAVYETKSTSQLFPYILHTLLDDADRAGHSYTGIISWCSDGRSFQLKNRELFTTSFCLPIFNTSKVLLPLPSSKYNSKTGDLINWKMGSFYIHAFKSQTHTCADS